MYFVFPQLFLCFILIIDYIYIVCFQKQILFYIIIKIKWSIIFYIPFDFSIDINLHLRMQEMPTDVKRTVHFINTAP